MSTLREAARPRQASRWPEYAKRDLGVRCDGPTNAGGTAQHRLPDPRALAAHVECLHAPSPNPTERIVGAELALCEASRRVPPLGNRQMNPFEPLRRVRRRGMKA